MLANGACCGTCPWKHIVWRESRTSCCGSMNLLSKDVKSPQALTYDQAWTPMKRLASVMETAPEDASMTEDAA